MTVINLPPEKGSVFEAQARARGLSVEQWMLELAGQSVEPVSIAHLCSEMARTRCRTR